MVVQNQERIMKRPITGLALPIVRGSMIKCLKMVIKRRIRKLVLITRNSLQILIMKVEV